ncbi:DNA primase, partial [Sphingomonas sp.]|uniref:DNA primase n=1 Tax=Sphingomonas sp. TaxID=28214 RepID=UPI00325FD44F
MIRDDIKAALVSAMKGGDKVTTQTLRMVSSTIKNRDIEARTGKAPEDDDLLITEVLQKMIKQRRESVELYRRGGREELAAVEQAEIATIERFMPSQMDEAQAKAAIGAVIEEVGAASMKDMGRVMALVKERHASSIEPAPSQCAGAGFAGLGVSLSPQFLDELRARTLLSAVIAPSVKLLRAGREWKACCPFHQEKTPSFTINDEKHFYHCFGCGAHGDAIRFLTDARGLPFMEAVKELAGKAGLDVPAADPRDREKAERSVGLTDVMAAAQGWFADTLAAPEGAEARAYLTNRGIDATVTKRFGLGLAPNARNRLKAALNSFGEEKLVDTGMLIKPDGDSSSGKDTYDRFRGRLMIPIRDPRGRVIAFGGRILGAKDSRGGEPKYLNSPETVLFDKGRTLYNIDRASPASRTAKRLIVVEGYMDVIALDRAGICEVVAPNGTSVTEAQLERMWRLDPAPILCFDGDSAGQKAAIRAGLRALPHLAPERTLRFVALPPGQDPDDLVRSGGRAALDALFAEPEPLVERLWRHERDAAPLTTPEARAGLRQRLIEHSHAIGDRSLASLYRDEWLARFDALFRPQRAQFGGGPARSFERRGKYDPKTRRFVFPEGPTGPEIRAIGSVGIDPSMARALLTGFALFPE